jgi:hypothetical protein
VQLKLGTRHKKDSLDIEGRKGGIELKEQATLCSLKWKGNRNSRPEVPWDESRVSFGGLLALGYGSK